MLLHQSSYTRRTSHSMEQEHGVCSKQLQPTPLQSARVACTVLPAFQPHDVWNGDLPCSSKTGFWLAAFFLFQVSGPKSPYMRYTKTYSVTNNQEVQCCMFEFAGKRENHFVSLPLPPFNTQLQQKVAAMCCPVYLRLSVPPPKSRLHVSNLPSSSSSPPEL